MIPFDDVAEPNRTAAASFEAAVEQAANDFIKDVESADSISFYSLVGFGGLVLLGCCCICVCCSRKARGAIASCCRGIAGLAKPAPPRVLPPAQKEEAMAAARLVRAVRAERELASRATTPASSGELSGAATTLARSGSARSGSSGRSLASSNLRRRARIAAQSGEPLEVVELDSDAVADEIASQVPIQERLAPVERGPIQDRMAPLERLRPARADEDDDASDAGRESTIFRQLMKEASAVGSSVSDRARVSDSSLEPEPAPPKPARRQSAVVESLLAATAGAAPPRIMPNTGGKMRAAMETRSTDKLGRIMDQLMDEVTRDTDSTRDTVTETTPVSEFESVEESTRETVTSRLGDVLEDFQDEDEE